MEQISRKEAMAQGLTKYFTGKRCSSGHLSERYASSGGCLECLKAKHKGVDVSPERLRQVIDYNPDTGRMTWKERQGNAVFNKMYAGKNAGNVSPKHKNNSSYYRVRVDNKLLLAHRVAWAMHHNEWPAGDIDHIDGNGLNNSISNLRQVSRAENIRNCRLSRNNSTGVNGVWKNAHGYVAEIMVNRKKISLGSYRTLEEAEAARKAADKIYGFFDGHGEKREQ